MAMLVYVMYVKQVYFMSLVMAADYYMMAYTVEFGRFGTS